MNYSSFFNVKFNSRTVWGDIWIYFSGPYKAGVLTAVSYWLQTIMIGPSPMSDNPVKNSLRKLLWALSTLGCCQVNFSQETIFFSIGEFQNYFWRIFSFGLDSQTGFSFQWFAVFDFRANFTSGKKHLIFGNVWSFVRQFCTMSGNSDMQIFCTMLTFRNFARKYERVWYTVHFTQPIDLNYDTICHWWSRVPIESSKKGLLNWNLWAFTVKYPLA